MPTERIRKVLSRSGHLNVEVEGVPYHSAYDPKREALKFYGAYSIEKADVILHFGWGLGYCGEVLRNRVKPSARVIVFEPDEELFEFALTHIDNRATLEDSRFEFVVGDRLCQFFDEGSLNRCRETDEFLWLIWPNAYRAHPASVSALQETFKVRLRDLAGNLLTHFQNGGLYFKNAIANFLYQGDPDAGRLFGRFKNLPLIIVSAGPSLDRNIRDLRGIEDRCFILAVDTVLRPLLAAGVMPHAVVIADPTELNARHVTGAIPEAVYLVAEQAVHPSAMSSASRRFLFGLGLFPDSLCLKFGFAKSLLQVWGSVATAALDLALKMEANPIIFTGQDCAYSWNRNYVRHTIFDGDPFDATQQATRASDIWGREVWTNENLIAYRDFFVRKIRQTSGVRFINATEGGILSEGLEILSLRDAIFQCCRESVDVAGILRRAHSPQFRTESAGRPAAIAAIDHLRHVLETRDSGCGCLGGYLELTAKEALLKGDDEGVNRSILSGWRICEEFCRTYAEGGVAPAYRGDARA